MENSSKRDTAGVGAIFVQSCLTLHIQILSEIIRLRQSFQNLKIMLYSVLCFYLIFVPNHVTFYLTDNILAVENVKKDIAGVLQCFAHNSAGSDVSTTSVTVIPNTVVQTRHDSINSGSNSKRKGNRMNRIKAVPSQPTVEKFSSDAVQLCWNVSNSDNIIYFKVQYCLIDRSKDSVEKLSSLGRGHKKWWTHWSSIPADQNCSVIEDLNAGNSYKFRVAAVYNSMQSLVGKSSRKFYLTPGPILNKPKTPELLTVRGFIGNQTVFIKWKHDPIIQTDGFLIHYKILGKKDLYHKLRFLGPDRREIYTHEVPTGRDLVVRLQAFNMAQDSDLSNALFFISNQQTAVTESPQHIITDPVIKTLQEKILPMLPDNRNTTKKTTLVFTEKDAEFVAVIMLSLGIMLSLLLVLASPSIYKYFKYHCHVKQMIRRIERQHRQARCE